MRPDSLAGIYALIRPMGKDHPLGEAYVRAWSERTGKSARAFYRRQAEMRRQFWKLSMCQCVSNNGKRRQAAGQREGPPLRA